MVVFQSLYDPKEDLVTMVTAVLPTVLIIVSQKMERETSVAGVSM